MISVYQLKSHFQDLLRPLNQKLVSLGVTANHITIAAAVFSVIYGALLCLDISVLWIFLPVILFIRMALNAIDGMLAREHNMKSKLGMALNEIGDVVADTALFIPFLVFAPNALWAVGWFIIMAILNELCGLVAYMMSGTRRYDGPMGKSDRAFATGTIGFLIGVGIVIPSYISWIFIPLIALTIWSCVNRIKGALKEEV